VSAPVAPRIYCVGTFALAAGSTIELPPAAARHLATVRRMRAGDAVTLFDGTGGEYPSMIVRADRSRVEVRVDSHLAVEREAPHPITLVQAVIAADNMDLVVRKAVELGVTGIVPVAAERSQRVADDRAIRRAEHWREIAIAACEQCGRNRIPVIADVTLLSKWTAELGRQPVPAVVLDPDAAQSLAATLNEGIPRVVVVGPEGGLTREEVAALVAAGATRCHLGPRMLRAETAAIATLATVNAVVGDAA